MPSGDYYRRKQFFEHTCPVCKKQYKHAKRFQNHLKSGKCKVAKKEPEEPKKVETFTDMMILRLEKLEEQSRAKDDIIRQLVAQVAELKTDLSTAQSTISDLVKKTGNLQRSNHYIKEKQEEANKQILASHEELKKETRKLQKDKFWFQLHQRAAAQQK